MAQQLVEDVFGDQDVYEVLGVSRTASAAQIKKAYFKKALIYHPDKNSDPAATKTFQALTIIHQCLSDPERRAIYDSEGVVEDAHEKLDQGWYDYWRNLFPKVTVEKIEEFKNEYQGSEEEKKDVIEAYLRNKGDLDVAIDEEIMLATEDDAPRFVKMLYKEIKNNGLKLFKKFEKTWSKSGKRKGKKGKDYADEAAEAEELAKKLGLSGDGGEDGLAAMIRQRQRSRGFESMMASLESKYVTKGKKATKKPVAEEFKEPSDEEFARIRASLDANRKQSKAKKPADKKAKAKRRKL